LANVVRCDFLQSHCDSPAVLGDTYDQHEILEQDVRIQVQLPRPEPLNSTKETFQWQIKAVLTNSIRRQARKVARPPVRSRRLRRPHPASLRLPVSRAGHTNSTSRPDSRVIRIAIELESPLRRAFSYDSVSLRNYLLQPQFYPARLQKCKRPVGIITIRRTSYGYHQNPRRPISRHA